MRVRDPDADCAAGERRGEETGLGLEHLRRRPPVFVGPRTDHGTVLAVDDRRTFIDPDRHHVGGGDELVDEVEDLIDPTAAREGVADGFDDVALTERAHRSGQPVR